MPAPIQHLRHYSLSSSTQEEEVDVATEVNVNGHRPSLASHQSRLSSKSNSVDHNHRAPLQDEEVEDEEDDDDDDDDEESQTDSVSSTSMTL